MKAKNILLIIALIAFACYLASFALQYIFAESISAKDIDNLKRIALIIGCSSTFIRKGLLYIERRKSKKAVSQQ